MKLKERRKHEVLTGKLLQTNRVDLYLPFFYGIMKTHLINGGRKMIDQVLAIALLIFVILSALGISLLITLFCYYYLFR